MWVKGGFSRKGGKTGRDFSFGEPGEGTPIDSEVKQVLKMSRKRCWNELDEHIIERPASSPSISGRSSVER